MLNYLVLLYAVVDKLYEVSAMLILDIYFQNKIVSHYQVSKDNEHQG